MTKWQKCKSKFHKKYISAISAENVQMCTISARLSVLYVLIMYIVYNILHTVKKFTCELNKMKKIINYHMYIFILDRDTLGPALRVGKVGKKPCFLFLKNSHSICLHFLRAGSNLRLFCLACLLVCMHIFA